MKRIALTTFITLVVLASFTPAFGCALCHKCSTDYRCTSVAANAKMQCMSTSGGCVAWDPCTSTATGDGCETEGDCVFNLGRAATPKNEANQLRLASVTVKNPHHRAVTTSFTASR